MRHRQYSVKPSAAVLRRPEWGTEMTQNDLQSASAYTFAATDWVSCLPVSPFGVLRSVRAL